jgi:hypothetical protein
MGEMKIFGETQIKEFTYKLLVGTIFKNRGLLVEREQTFLAQKKCEV